MTKLTEHFTLDELVFSSTAARKGIDNSPSAEILANLSRLAHCLEYVRTRLDAPMYIDSGYRCPELNKAVGGSKSSAHMQGYAADFRCPEFGTPLQIVRSLADSNIGFDQCIQEGRWVHISFDPLARRQVMTAHFGPDGTTYTSGVS